MCVRLCLCAYVWIHSVDLPDWRVDICIFIITISIYFCCCLNYSFVRFYRSKKFCVYCAVAGGRHTYRGNFHWITTLNLPLSAFAVSTLAKHSALQVAKVSKDMSMPSTPRRRAMASEGENHLARCSLTIDHEWFTLKTHIKYKLVNAAILVARYCYCCYYGAICPKIISDVNTNHSQKQWISIHIDERTTDFALFENKINICSGLCVLASQIPFTLCNRWIVLSNTNDADFNQRCKCMWVCVCVFVCWSEPRWWLKVSLLLL